MKLAILPTALVLVIGLLSSSVALGQGRGLNRSLGQPGTPASAAATARMTSPSPAASSASRGQREWQRAGAASVRMPPSALSRAADSQRATSQARILDQRLQQAEHLRGVADQNGNERLLSTADRMEANALQNHDRPTQLAPSSDRESRSVARPPHVAPASSKGFWFRSR